MLNHECFLRLIRGENFNAYFYLVMIEENYASIANTIRYVKTRIKVFPLPKRTHDD